MILTAIQTNELGQMMREHITCILRMEAVRLDLDWAAEFSPKQILSCCDRMIEHLDCTINFPPNVQRELICSPEFAPWLARLMALAGKTAADDGAEDAPPSWDNLAKRLDKLLEVCRTSEKPVVNYSEEDTLFVLKQIDLTADTRLTYLENYAPTKPDDGAKAQIAKNLSACGTVPGTLNDSQRELLEEPFVATRGLFASADFEDIWALFQFCPTLTDIAQLLHQKDIDEHLDLTDYQYFAEDGAEYLRLLTLVLQRLSKDAASRFLHHWRENNCALSELRRMERRVRAIDAREFDIALVSYIGYVNLIYGCRFKKISLFGLAKCQATLLLYAITHEKKHFIRLVDENAEKFLGLSGWSILFREPLYRSHFNLNELTAKDLDDCGWMTCKKLPKNLLEGTHQYTFPELKLLYDAPEPYIALYHKLRAPRLDDRIKVLRQLRKRDVLSEITSEAELAVLAERLDQKPLADWWRGEFGHIRDIQAEDAAQMLIHLDRLRPLLPDIQCRADVMLALRCLEHIDQFASQFFPQLLNDSVIGRRNAAVPQPQRLGQRVIAAFIQDVLEQDIAFPRRQPSQGLHQRKVLTLDVLIRGVKGIVWELSVLEASGKLMAADSQLLRHVVPLFPPYCTLKIGCKLILQGIHFAPSIVPMSHRTTSLSDFLKSVKKEAHGSGE